MFKAEWKWLILGVWKENSLRPTYTPIFVRFRIEDSLSKGDNNTAIERLNEDQPLSENSRSISSSLRELERIGLCSYGGIADQRSTYCRPARNVTTVLLQGRWAIEGSISPPRGLWYRTPAGKLRVNLLEADLDRRIAHCSHLFYYCLFSWISSCGSWNVVDLRLCGHGGATTPTGSSPTWSRALLDGEFMRRSIDKASYLFSYI